MDPEQIMSGISKELLAALSTMAKSKTTEEKLKCSEIVKNLSESFGVFLAFIENMALYDEYEDDEDNDGTIPF